MEEFVDIFIDESKPEYSESPDDRPLIYFARCFPQYCKNQWEPLKQHINQATILDWHSRSFLRSEEFPAILKILNALSFVPNGYIMVRKASFFKSLIETGYINTIARNNLGAKFFKDFPWNEKDIDANALFYFINNILTRFDSSTVLPFIIFELPKNAFHSSIEDFLSYRDNGYLGDYYGGYMVRGVAKKKKKGSYRNYVHWTNLCDGELWILQRLLMTELSDGSSLWQRALNSESAKSTLLLSDEDAKYIRNNAPNRNPTTDRKRLENRRFFEYIISFLTWTNERRVVDIDLIAKD